MNFQLLKTELIAGHPITGAYSANNATAANQLNVANTTSTVETVTGSQVLNATDSAEFSALTDGEKDDWMRLCGIDEINVTSGPAKQLEAEIFGVGTTTRTNLLALKNPVVTRGVFLGLGLIREGDVQYARSLP